MTIFLNVRSVLQKAYDHNNNSDSSLYYGLFSYNLSHKEGFPEHALDASLFLSQLYKKENKIDSAFAYQEIMLTLKDSIESIEKIKQIESITIEEQLRQKQIADQIEQDKEDRREKLQLLAIGIMIPIFFLLSIYISRKKVHRRIIEFSGIISILLLFEYITLLIHPFVAEKTNHSPFPEIIIFVCIASLITPAHHRIQAMLISKLTKIRELHRKVHEDAPIIAEENSDQENISPLTDITDQ
jgi:hypothetical protein